MNQQLDERWKQYQRRNHAKTQSWACIHCPDKQIFLNADELWRHACLDHDSSLPLDKNERENYRIKFEAECANKRNTRDDSSRKPTLNEATTQPEPPPLRHDKRPLSTPLPPPRSLSALEQLNLGTPRGSDDITMQDVSENEQSPREKPRKRAALGDGISAGSASPYRDSSASPPPRRSKARPTSVPYGSRSEEERRFEALDTARPHVSGKQLWTADAAPPISRSSVDPLNIASAHRTQQFKHKAAAKGFQLPSPSLPNPQASSSNTHTPGIIPRPLATPQPQAKQDGYDIVLQPETRPISQEQLVAEVKGIYAGLVMVEAKCIEVDNKQATLAGADPGAQPKLNNEQWQALIALHRTLLHEHHDFFLASQHPSASAALRRLASKYAMPARMWRHGIHSFLELLRHRLPASLDHMLAFIYLAYSMMALLYETVPAFEDTWIECLGDLARYRMAIEDDDIRDREVWTGVARHWYSKASDNAPTTGRLYHHLAILARPNALQQLFYYSKSLCVEIPFTSARESILTLFEPVLTSNGQGHYRLPPLDTVFVRAHGLLFTGRHMDKFETTVKEFLGLLDSQIGRVTRKFMEQGYHIAIANSVAILGFASKENLLMQAIENSKDTDQEMSSTTPSNDNSSFKHAQHLSNATLEIVLQRIGDPNVLPFIHVSLVFILYVSSHPGAMGLLQADFPWDHLSVMLNTLLGSYKTPVRIENDEFPLPEKDDVRPFPEDYAMRGLLWTEKYFPDKWFNNEKIDEEDKYREVASMTEQRRERILSLAFRISKLGPWIQYDRSGFSVPSNHAETMEETSDEIDPIESRTSTFASATTTASIGRTGTWESLDEDVSEPEDQHSTAITQV